MKALILMAGKGSRFEKAGYTFPKPLIDVNGKLMIEWVVGSLPACDEYIFVAQREHAEKYGLQKVLDILTDGRARTVLLDGVTSGAACSALMAEPFINNSDDLIIANSDQFVEYNVRNFLLLREAFISNGIIFTFESLHPKWSYVITKNTKVPYVSRVVEKEVVSDIATCGIYWFRTGNLFVDAAKSMISKNIKTNGEFYLAPVYNELIQNGHAILPFWVDRMHGLGTPEDLENFLRGGLCLTS